MCVAFLLVYPSIQMTYCLTSLSDSNMLKFVGAEAPENRRFVAKQIRHHCTIDFIKWHNGNDHEYELPGMNNEQE